MSGAFRVNEGEMLSPHVNDHQSPVIVLEVISANKLISLQHEIPLLKMKNEKKILVNSKAAAERLGDRNGFCTVNLHLRTTVQRACCRSLFPADIAMTRSV